ncbi:MAG: hypothetical protein LZF61_02225 [Nitrosomonas sp.]|nr:MAG: hypothetical protein LZF61_02225 [Nitrosomonas sp.]
MKITQRFVFAIVLLLCWCPAVRAVSIVYDGFECLNIANPDDPTPQGTPAQSRFEVIEEVGEGIYRLSVTGGIPRVVGNSAAICIDSVTALGFSGIPAIDGVPQALTSGHATAYFSGRDLIIVVNAMVTDLSQRREPLSAFSTSNIFAYTYTLILELNTQASQFMLKKIIRNRGYTQTSGSTNSFTPFFETVLPFFNSGLSDRPVILTPASEIVFRLE